MRIVGRRSEPPIVSEPSGRLLEEGARAMEALRRMPGGNIAFIPKGVYRFLTLREADTHRDECLAAAMAQLARKRA